MKSKFFREVRWLRAWDVEEKKAELWNVIAELVEQMRFRDFKAEKTYFIFSRYSAGITSSQPANDSGKSQLIATVKPCEFPAFRALWDDIETSTQTQQENALGPLVESVFEQVYGKRI
jgi:hypothetical protein